MIKVVHIITGLAVGGAETMLYKLTVGMDRNAFENHVVSLSGPGPIGDKMAAAGIGVQSLDMQSSAIQPGQFFRLARWLRDLNPDVIQTWMYHSDLIGGLAARVAGNRPILWNIRHAQLPPGAKRTTRLIGRLCAKLSPVMPAEILCCSEAAMVDHIGLGYPIKRLTVVPNGFDLSRLFPSQDSRSKVRTEIGIDEGTPLIGMVGRFDELKDHANFAEAAGILLKLRPDVQFLLCGEGMTHDNAQLVGWLENSCALDSTHLLGRRTDIPEINAALDVATLSSFSEGFPNVLGEAMACGVPCVATDAGDSSMIVGATGLIVPTRDSRALALGWLQFLDLPNSERRELGMAARARIESNFSIEAVVKRYESIYRKHSIRIRSD